MTSHLEQQFADLWLNLYPDIDLTHIPLFGEL
mgnify:FL=1